MKSMAFLHFFFLILLQIFNLSIITHSNPQIPRFSILPISKSLSVEKQEDYLLSPNGTFSSGFYKVGINAYSYAIWFTHSADKTVVWMANRDKPVSSKRSKLSLHRNGNLVLTDADGSPVWSTDTFSKSNAQLHLLETGNLVLVTGGDDGVLLWDSFLYPTDTLLPNQPLRRNTTLVSMRNPGTYLSGFYKFKFDDNNVMNLIYDGPLYSSVYWPSLDITIFDNKRTPYNSTRIAAFNRRGRFRSSDNVKFNSTDFGFGPERRLTLDYDGLLRLYSLNPLNGLWEISWLPGGLDSCRVHGLCGPNGICNYTPNVTCFCPVGFYQTDPLDWFMGCTFMFNLTCAANISTDLLGFVMIPNSEYYGNDLNTYGLGMSFETCRNACLIDCKCVGFAYSHDGKGECFPKRSLLNGYHMPEASRNFHIKIPIDNTSVATTMMTMTTRLNCTATSVLELPGNVPYDEGTKRNPYMRYLVAFVCSFAVIEAICIVLGWWLIFPRHVHEELVNMGYIALVMGFKRFGLAELKCATQNFKQEIGKGGFGTVYKGVLDNGRVVAVKRLEGVVQGEAEFWAEVSIIGKLNHRNLVKLWGFCVDDDQKLLVYEYMENGSLDRLLFSNLSTSLGFDKRYNIALGTAKALSYIHEECLEWVLHCDVKPQNILLDDQLEAKVADFGMSKLLKDNNNYDLSFSRVRGTRGYLAPEWMMNQMINAKADVYSYGIVLLELISGKRACSNVERDYYLLVDWMKKKMKEGGGTKDNMIMEVMDPRIQSGEYDEEKARRLLRIALTCVNEERDKRPAMSEVVELLSRYGELEEGDEEDEDIIGV